MTRSAAPPTASSAAPILRIGTADSSSMVDLQGEQTTALQQYRELTMNALQGVANRPDGAGGKVVWDADWGLVEASDGRQRKLSVTDTGCGMTGEELLLFINNLASSGQKKLGASDNHGTGAKIAAGYHNPRGLRYRSWRDGRGSQIVFRKHGGEWGLERQRPGEGDEAFVQPLSAAERPWLLEDADSGTIATLFGHGDREDTTAAPKEMEFKGASWLRKYLNQRFFRMPAGVEVFVREGNQIKVGSGGPASSSACSARRCTSSAARSPPVSSSCPRRASRTAPRPCSGGSSTATSEAVVARPPTGAPPATSRRCSRTSSTTPGRRPRGATVACRASSASGSATSASSCT